MDVGAPVCFETARRRIREAAKLQLASIPQNSTARREVFAERKKGEKKMRQIVRGISRRNQPAGFTYLCDDTLAKRLEVLTVQACDGASDGSAAVIWMLDEDGAPLWTVSRGRPADDAEATTLVVGDQLGYALEDEALLMARADVRRVALGPTSLLTSQCIILAHHHLDTLGTRFDPSSGKL
mmetsp:Transcript_26420/g.87607  ORF Transcript_26420/g.87607 Transcript_26420/m.87607 type:complete len:182 (-) Transcript_26420:492-1037(-)